MELNVMLEPQEGLSYADILAVAQRAEALGFAGFYRSDHYTSVADRVGLASTDAWATLAGLAVQTSRLKLGVLVSPATFRPAGNLAKVVATVAEMAGTLDGGSRVELGLGTGWLEEEHRQFGFPFEDLGTRFRRLEEHLQVVRGLWDPAAAPFSFAGEFEHLEGARCAPVPDPRPRILLGGRGRRRTPRLAARYGDELNVTFPTPAFATELRAALDRACEEVGRDPDDVAFSVMTGCLVGATPSEVTARARRLAEQSGDTRPADDYLAGLRGEWVIGTPEEAADHLGALADAGVQRIMLQHQLADDLDMLDVVMEEVAPRLGVTVG